eukprot:Sspe_Gene.66829::Locus_39486_Transcript_1_1_Confidence_1.000_Length_1493::g.66829::m.66829/K03500/rsmB, sun; 16S rRNA (cytosine967-C5)-methyltransferase
MGKGQPLDLGLVDAARKGLHMVFTQGMAADEACRRTLRKKAKLDNAARAVVARRILCTPQLQARLRHQAGLPPPPPLDEKGNVQTVPHSVADTLLVAYIFAEEGVEDEDTHAALLSHLGLGKELLKHLSQPSPLPEGPAGIAVSHSVPMWLVEHMTAQLGGLEGCAAFCKLLNEPADIAVRVNTHLASPTEVRQLLVEDGMEVDVHPLSDACLVLRRSKGVKPNVRGSRAWQQGTIEVQDCGSQLLAKAACLPRDDDTTEPARKRPRPSPVLLDYCCGLGGKTLSLASLHPHGRVVAADISAEAVRELPNRLKRCKLEDRVEVRKHPLSSDVLADSVIVDAPCSGVGRLRRRTDNRWRFDPLWLESYPPQQLSILRHASRHVAPGGYLVYSTCTINRRENEDVCREFADSDEGALFRPAPLLDVLGAVTAGRLGIDETAAYATFLPHVHNTDGFFVHRWQRVDDPLPHPQQS